MKLFIFSFHVNEIFSTYFQHKIRKRKKCLWTSLVVTVRQTSGTENWNNNIRTAPNRRRLLENGTEQRTKCFEDYRLVGNFKTWISMEKPFQNNNKKMVKEENHLEYEKLKIFSFTFVFVAHQATIRRHWTHHCTMLHAWSEQWNISRICRHRPAEEKK